MYNISDKLSTSKEDTCSLNDLTLTKVSERMGHPYTKSFALVLHVIRTHATHMHKEIDTPLVSCYMVNDSLIVIYN